MNKTTLKYLWWAAIAAVLILAAGLVVTGLVNATNAEAKIQATPFVGEENREQILYYQSLLNDKALTGEARASIEEKLEMAVRVATQRAQSEGGLGMEGQGVLPTSEAVTDPEFQSGIFEGDEGIFQPEVAVIENFWQGKVDDRYIQVFAGADGSDLTQGLLIVSTTSANRLETDFERHPTPQKEGSVKVSLEQDGIVTLQTANGTEFLFDVRARTFR